MDSQEDALLEEHPVERSAQIPGELVIGTVSGVNEEGSPLVSYPGSPSGAPVVALTTLAITRQQLGRSVALLFTSGNSSKPVIMGLIHEPLAALLESFVPDQVLPSGEEAVPTAQASSGDNSNTHAYVDGERVVIEGRREIVLRCGAASITLTAAGKVLIKGQYLLSRSDGVNRIQGGSVQVN